MTKQQTSMQSNLNLNLDLNSTNVKKLKFLQHNCVKSTNVMYACLKYAKKSQLIYYCYKNHELETTKQFYISTSHASCYDHVLRDSITSCLDTSSKISRQTTSSRRLYELESNRLQHLFMSRLDSSKTSD